MRAAYFTTPLAEDPVNAIEVGDLDLPEVPDGWSRVDIYAGALNMHDLWMLQGVATVPGGAAHVIGSDGAGICEGQEVLVYPVLPTQGRSLAHSVLLSDRGYGLLAEQAVVPAGGVVPKPAHLTWEEAAAIPTAWLTAYRMLFTKARIRAGQTVLVQGAGGGVSTAVIALAKAAGASVIVTSRSAAKRERALEVGADVALPTGERVPELADIVIESVGPATFDHSVMSTRAGGTIVVCGASTGFTTPLNLARLFAREITVQGSTMGTREEFAALVDFIERHRIRPTIDSTVGLDDIRVLAKRMLGGDAFGKLCAVVR
ncbi:NADPH:quinone reductase [Thermomonospora echinospora]|uniref:NADPH:quinone reductase n=1 Tax=Thermomonospora echinospora TaxID=1992 RepID=A0A1H6DM39_9ACTN|nr:zinc-binding dehydrogenase [Thermomonospora echinospora]SEG86380.1 NADPH:quinone reductase [Thermomonospora echinospora]